jgi:hypothetical protein
MVSIIGNLRRSGPSQRLASTTCTSPIWGHVRLMDDTETQPSATSGGSTQSAGADTTDEEFAAQVARQTDPNLEAQDVFERDSDGETADEGIADTSADDLQ